MELSALREREQIQTLLDMVPREKLAAVRNILEEIVDEPVSEEDRRRIREGQAWFAERGGRGIPMNEVLAEFGLTPDDFPLDK